MTFSPVMSRLRSAVEELRDWPVAARALALACAAAIALLGILDGGLPTVGAALIVALGAGIAAAIVAEPRDRRFVIAVIAIVVLGRELVTLVFDLVVVARSGTHVFAPDEGLYMRLAGNIVDNWHDPSVFVDELDGNIQSEYVRTAARIFFLVGTDIPIVKLMNTGLAILMGLLVYRTMVALRLPGRRWTLVLLSIIPSIVLWSSLALKDAYVWFFVAATVWSSAEYIRSRNHWWHLVTLAALLPLESVRRYIFVTMLIAWLFVVLAVEGKERLRVGAVTITTLIAVLLIVNPLRDLGVNPFYLPIVIRGSAAAGARTSFVEPLPVMRGNPGERFVVQATNATPAPGTTPREVIVEPGAQIVFEGSPVPKSGPVAVVRPGDVVVFAATGSSATPANASTPRIVVLNPEAKNMVSSPIQTDGDSSSVGGSLTSNLKHLPIGLLYVVAAPFPWAINTRADLATIPESLIWYVCVLLAAIGVWQVLRRRNFSFAHGAAALAGMAIVFALIEGNVGTLIRSRDMIVPFTLVFTGIGIEYVTRRWPRLVPARLVALMDSGGWRA